MEVRTLTLDETILKLVSDREIPDQATFLAMLERAGFKATQPTLSRRMKKLGIQKFAGHYQQVEPPPAGMPRFTLTSVSPSLLVIRTRPGYAQPLAVCLDQKKIAGVVGTIAGDDTVFIAVTAPPPIAVVAEAVGSLLSEKAST
ncbi:MAG: arginine repressor [Gammaproteobacteria bacterium]